MPTVAEAFSLALRQHQAGNFSSAEQIYRQILQSNPSDGNALHMLGVIAYQVGQPETALIYIRQAIASCPGEATIHVNLGLVYRALGRSDDALASFQHALELNPNASAAHNNLGNLLRDQKKLQEAEASYRQALSTQPNMAEAHNNLGAILCDQGKTDEAAACFQAALRFNPDYAEACTNLGNALHSMERVEEAAAWHRQALTLNPTYAEAHNNLGLAERKLGRLEEAVACHRRALQVKPNLAEIHINLAGALTELGLIPDAIECYRRALELQPDNLAVVAELAHQLQRICLWDDLQPLSQRVIEAVEKGPERSVADSVSPFAFLALPTFTSAHQQHLCARKWAAQRLGSVPNHSPFTFDRLRRPQDKIKVGYLSADFHEHATAYLIAEVIEKHNRGRFAIHAFSYGPDNGSPMRRRLVKAFDRFADLKETSSLAAAQQIHAEEIDILVDLKGYTRHARTPIMALRPAPVQVQYLGYPGTMGADFIDFILADDFVVPPEQQPFYSEKLVHLPGCYQCNDSQRPIAAHTPSRAECGLPEEGFVFSAFNNPYKITPEMFDVWMRLLKAVPGSVLWLIEDSPFATVNLRSEARSRGVNPERLVFAPRMPLAEHLARQRLAELFLDTVPYNGHTTASDALWVGCPVLTIAGQTFPARVAGSLLRTIGLPELITTSLEQYEALALRLAQDAGLLANLRARLQANRATSRLFDGSQFARSVEEAYATMWEIYTSGQEARSFAVPL